MEPGSTTAPLADVDAAAKEHVIAALRRLHCSIVRCILDTNGRSPVEAWKVRHHLLLHVTSAVEPDDPPDLTQREKRAFRQLAARANAEPWMAKVLLRPDLELVRLDWWPLEALDPRE